MLLSYGTSPCLPSLLLTDLLAPRADFIYMVPPFLAYYGADTQNASVLLQSYTQCQLYRQVLQPSSGGAWMHIMGPQNQDTGLWSTGNG